MDEIIEVLVERYMPLAEGNEMLEAMMATMLLNRTGWPVDKLNRWLGFVQGCLFMEGKLDVDEERNFTRSLFHKYYKDNGIDIPKSVKV